jgi:gas vesicle protein
MEKLSTTDKDFEQMMQMLTGFFVTQIAGAVATYSIADHLAKGARDC